MESGRDGVVIAARRVVKVFGGTAALKGVDLRVAAGDVVSVEGANGSGKSTLLALLGRLMRPSSGEVVYAATDLAVGWVAHEGWCYGDLSGRANLEVVGAAYGLDGSAIAEAESRFEIGAFGRRPVKTYSRGQRQRVALAMAVMCRPAVLLLDEPTTGLDRRGVERLVEVVERERERGAAIVVVSHDGAVSERAGTRRVILDRGRIVEEARRLGGRWESVSRETIGEA